MDEDFELLLETGFHEPPEDFADRMMARVGELPLPELVVRPICAQERLQWLALVGTGLVAAVQLAAFMFGIWTATVAG